MKKYISSFLVIFAIAAVVFSSCKSDPKDVDAKMEVDAASTLKVNDITVDANALKNAQQSGLYTAEQRLKDSLEIVEKMSKSGRDVSESEIQKMLSQNEVRTFERKQGSARGYIPSVCYTVSAAEVSKFFDIPESVITIASGNKGKVADDTSQSCFYRWGQQGFLIQVSGNPLPDEINDWATRYMNTKKMSGETSMSGSDQYKYVDFDGPGEQNILNKDLGRYYISKGEDYIISLLFNGNFKNSRNPEIASKILKRVYDKI